MLYFYEIPLALRMVLQIFLLAGIASQMMLMLMYSFFRRGRQYILNFLLELGILYFFIMLNLSLGFIQLAEPKNLIIYPYAKWRNLGMLAPILGMPVLMNQHRQSDLIAILCLIFTLPFMEALAGVWYVNLCAFFTAILLIRSAYELKQNLSHLKQNITRFSMKQAFDTFPEGLAIGRQHGSLNFTNAKMRQLMADKGLAQDKRTSGLRVAFRRMLKEEELAAKQADASSLTLTRISLEQEIRQKNEREAKHSRGNKRRSHDVDATEPVPNLRSFESAGRIYRYQESSFQVGHKAYWEVLITDISEESRLIQEIQEKNQDLAQNNQQLGLMLQNIEEIELEKETRRMRNRIHDVMGQRLSILHSSLQQMDRREEVPLTELLDLLEDMMDDLQEEKSFDSEQIFRNIQNTADIVGTKLTKEGDIPAHEEVATIFLQILREAVTNAIRHGQADEVLAKFYEDEDNYYLDISNSGRLPDQSVQEGEGISGMRHKLAALAGSLEIITSDPFTIKVRVPHFDNLSLKS